MKKNKKRFGTMPAELYYHIQTLDLGKTLTNKSIDLCNLILKKSKNLNGIYTSFVPISKRYKEKIYTTAYNDFFTPLLDNEIIEAYQITPNTDYYSTEKGICKSYRINPRYFAVADFSIKSFGYTQVSDYNEIELTELNQMSTYFIEDLEWLKIDYKALNRITDNKINNLSIQDFRVNAQIQNETINLNSIDKNYTWYNITLTEAIQKASSYGLSVIQNKGNFFMYDEQRFIEEKKNGIRLAYHGAIMRLQKGMYNVSRNKTNMRLDTNFTNLCSELTNFIIQDNNLIQLDIVNSQFAFLAHILPASLIGEDVARFKKICQDGKLYEVVQEVLKLESRKEAKLQCFQIIFGKNSNTELTKEFPSVMTWINDWKKNNPDEQFSNLLSRAESEIMIDGVYMKLKEQGLFCLTKHDSIIIKKQDKANALKIMKQIFKQNKFKCTLSTK